MLQTAWQHVSHLLVRKTFRWSIARRLLSVLISTSVLVVLIADSAVLLYLQGQVGSTRISEWRMYAGALAFALILAVGATTAISGILFYRLGQRITRVAVQVERQLISGELDIAVPPEYDDEIGRFIVLLNRLGQAYRASLQALARNANEMAMLDRVASTINQTLDLQQVLDTSLHEALKTVGWDAGAIYMWDDRTETLNMVSFTGFSEEIVRRNISHKLGEGLIGISAANREILVYPAGESTKPDGLEPSPGLPSVQISLPLEAVPGQLLGSLVLATGRARTVTDDERRLLKTVSTHIALALDKAQLYTQVSRHAEELEQLVAARTEQLSQAIDELWIALKQAQEADRVKSLLLSTVSHELRTPLATIKGSTSLLLEHHKRIPREQVLEYLKDIEEETDKLTNLISNLLEMSRIEAGTLHIVIQSTSVAEIVKSSVHSARLRHKDREIVFEPLRTSIMCDCDALRIEQVLSNLIDNAVKYSPQRTAIKLKIVTSGQEAVISVSDRGIGIASEYLDRIFDRFFQVKHGSDSGRHGIGLGLAICRGLLEAQGGRIWVDSKLKRGSTFYVGLPISQNMQSQKG